jgi:hypothetical protein
MKTLHNNWITEGTLDFEYKKYVLLAYLQHCKANFTESKLYPPLSELVDHYRNIVALRKNVTDLKNKFPKEISGFDINGGELMFQATVPDDNSIDAVSEIVEFAIPTMQTTLDEGKEVYEFVENNLELQPVGLLPVYADEGYVLINEDDHEDVHVYQYKMSFMNLSDERFRSLNMNYVYRDKKSLSNSFEQIKLKLVKRFSELPNPATFLCLSRLHIPLFETLLPVTKRLLLKNISSSGY